MGQYYVVVNVDKKEALNPHQFDCGVKLMEWSYIGNDVVNALLNLLANKWKGDRVYVVGDYTDLGDYNGDSKHWHDVYAGLVNEFNIHDGDYQTYPESHSLYALAGNEFKHLQRWADVRSASTFVKYLYNTATKEYVDLSHCPTNEHGYTIAPISLLLSMGGDRGGGDYHSSQHNADLVGAWVPTSQYIVASEDPILEYADFVEFKPDFYERW